MELIDLEEIKKEIYLSAKDDIEQISEEALEIFKEEARTSHANWKASGGPTETGQLAESITKEPLSLAGYQIGYRLQANAKYAPAVAYGRTEVKVKHAKFLYANNEFFNNLPPKTRLKRVGPFNPGKDNFLDIAVEKIKKLVGK